MPKNAVNQLPGRMSFLPISARFFRGAGKKRNRV
jgi:hypothetical protein